MKLYVGIADEDWFDEVNFWQPAGGRDFRVLEPGEPFLFKLHAPRNYIVGGGFFATSPWPSVAGHRRRSSPRCFQPSSRPAVVA